MKSSKGNSNRSPLNIKKGKAILRELCIRQRNKSRKYSMKDLNSVRHLFRSMPTNINEIDGLLSHGSPGLGLQMNVQNSLSKRIDMRKKQIELGKSTKGYKNFILLIPKNERIAGIHPSTPRLIDIQTSPKRRFQGKISVWRRQLHQFDNFEYPNQLPYHLMTENMRNINGSKRGSVKKWSPKSAKKSEKKDVKNTGDGLRKQLDFMVDFQDDIKDEYPSDNEDASPTKAGWFMEKDGAIVNNESNERTHQISKEMAVQYLEESLQKMNFSNEKETNLTSDLLDEFKSRLQSKSTNNNTFSIVSLDK